MAHALPLRALTIFNEVAKSNNLTRTAESLGISQSAISHQIRELETRVGRQLLLRHPQGVSLTEHGMSLFSSTAPAFKLLDAGFKDVCRKQRKRSLTISLPPALATKWLVPRLDDFKAQYPDIDLFMDTSDALIDFETSDVDIAIRYAVPSEGEYYMSVIRDEFLVAVLSPSLSAQVRESVTNPTINDYPFLEDTFDSRWADWLKLSGQKLETFQNPPVKFTDSAVMISAAISGQGVALARRIMVEDDLAQGRLILFSPDEVQLERKLLFLCRRSERNEEGVAAFRKWIIGLE